MSSIISTDNQGRWKDSCAASSKVGLTLIANGEEPVQVYTQDRQLVPAGIAAPTEIPTVSDGGAGTLTAGYAVYRYVYASSKYPFVEAVTAAGGQLWPKSNPSGPSLTYTITVSHQNNVTVTKTTRSDIDKILIYRTAIKSTAADAEALSTAGNLYYVGVVANNGIAGTTVFVDNIGTNSMQEQLELDNYECAQFAFVVYEDPRWYGFGNRDLIVEVTLDATTTIVAPAKTFYAGRQNQFVTFDGITTGGFDGKGTFYFSYVDDSKANVALEFDGTAAGVSATGTTTMRVRGYTATLYMSKPRNPFAWGYTQYSNGDDGSVERLAQQYAFPVGGRGSALAVLPREKLLKLDTENPSACYTLTLALAGLDGFEASKRTLDRQYVATSHASQFQASFPGGATALAGIDASNRFLVRANASKQEGFGDEAFATLASMVTTGDNARLTHGVYDQRTELSVWWIKTAIDPDNLISIDTAICYHGPSGQFSTFLDFDVTASASVYDPVTLETITLVGTAGGQIAQAFVAGVWANLTTNTLAKRTFTISAAAREVDSFNLIGLSSDPGPSAGAYIDIGDTDGPVRLWLSEFAGVGAPTAPTGGRLIEAIGGAGIDIFNATSQMVTALGADSAFEVLSSSQTGAQWRVVAYGTTPALSVGTVGAPAITLTQNTAGDYGVTISPSTSADPYAWAFFDNGSTELWVRANADGVFTQAVVYDPATGEAGTASFGIGQTGDAYIGLINCEAQTYFQPSQTRASTPIEIWGTFRNHDTAGDLFYRLYEDFETSATGAPIEPTQATRRTGVNSMNWAAKNVPSVQANQIGYRLVERGYEAFEVLGLEMKQNRT